MKHLFLAILLFLITWPVSAQRLKYPNVQNLKTSIANAQNINVSFFSDMGAWHAYALPKSSDEYGGFIGPLLMKMHGEWLSKNIAKLHIIENGKEIHLQQANTVLRAYPGLFVQQLQKDSLLIRLMLIFISNRESYLQTTIKNLSSHHRDIKLKWTGKIFSKDTRLKESDHGLEFTFNNGVQSFYIHYLTNPQVIIDSLGRKYTSQSNVIDIPSGQIFSTTQSHSYYPFGKVKPSLLHTLSFSSALRKNEDRWNGYLKSYFSGMQINDINYRRLAVKSIETLITNWRSPAGDLLHNGVFPSASYQGFYGVWSWDSWKQAVALAYFNPELAEDNIVSMFDYQEPDGMVPDVIYPDKSKNNLRDTKPPLDAWAVLNIFKQTQDTFFIESLYLKLFKYHQWWYENRDHDQNGICEFGSTDGTRIAAAWESGMDNAVRFDSAKMLKNNDHAWSLNQESVDLNCYLYKEKLCLAQLAGALGKKEEKLRFLKDAERLKDKINQDFYDPKSGYYYDRRLGTHELIFVQGSIGWIPLWVGIANNDQAKNVMEKMMDRQKFNTYVPLPVLSSKNPNFDPKNGYWRGPVWLDQFYFGIRGLKRYGFNKQADILQKKLFNHAKKLLGNGPIHENYDPITGIGLNSKNFSWSAAHILMMLKEKDSLN